jgi:hypothetical protein
MRRPRQCPMEGRLALIAMPKFGTAARWRPRVLRAQMRRAQEDEHREQFTLLDLALKCAVKSTAGVGSTGKYPLLPACNFSRINRALFHQSLRQTRFRLPQCSTWTALRKSRDLTGKFSGAPDALLRVEAGIHQRLVVGFGGVLVESGGRLGTEVAVPSVEVEGADAVLAADTGEAHAALHSFSRVVSH